MKHVSIAAVDVTTSDGGADRYGLSDPLNTTGVAINRYVLAPGERISSLHAHLDQEEVFVVRDGTVTFETWTPDTDLNRSSGQSAPGGEITVGVGEVIRFAPGDFQSGRNDADEEAVMLALGAPRDTEGVRIPLACPDCGHACRRPAVAEGGTTPVLVCPACGTERDATCPACGGNDVGAVLAEDGTEVVGVCRNCGAESSA